MTTRLASLIYTGQYSVGQLVKLVARETGSEVKVVRRHWRQFYNEAHRANLLLLQAPHIPTFSSRQIFQLEPK